MVIYAVSWVLAVVVFGAGVTGTPLTTIGGVSQGVGLGLMFFPWPTDVRLAK